MKQIGTDKSTQGLRRLIEDITLKCINNNYTINFIPDSVNPKNPLGGYVDSETRVVNIITGYNGWVTTLPHEASHLDQALERSDLWTNKLLRNYSIFEPKRHPNKKVSESIYFATCKLEVDCDIRAVEKIKEYELSHFIDTDDYIQTANTYHASFMYFYEYKCFYHHKFNPSLVDEIRNLFPTNLILDANEAWTARPLLGDYIKKHHKSYM